MGVKMYPSESIAGLHGSRRFAKSFEASSTCTGRKKFERADNCKRKLHNNGKSLPHRLVRRSPTVEGGSARRAKAGWSPERRVRQAALIRTWAPWRRSTGPKTEAGKARCAENALRHGGRSSTRIRELQRIRYALRLAAENIRKVRLFIRLRDAWPRIKYKQVALALQPKRWAARPQTCPTKPVGGSPTCTQGAFGEGGRAKADALA
jgi:hypothetical protein